MTLTVVDTKAFPTDVETPGPSDDPLLTTLVIALAAAALVFLGNPAVIAAAVALPALALMVFAPMWVFFSG